MTPLAQARADAVICRSAARALLQHLDLKRYRDDKAKIVPKVLPRVRPEQVAAEIATYHGLALPHPLARYVRPVQSLVEVYQTLPAPLRFADEITGTAPIQDGRLTIKKPRRRWPWSK